MSAGPYRLRQDQHAREIAFRFNGRAMLGVEGDTVASALLANGVRTVSRSFKFHRPRGIFSAGFEEPNALVQINAGAASIPLARATLTPLAAGLDVASGIGWPGISFDLLRAIDFLHPVFAAGFYNKTFIWPGWHFYEPVIRKLAGFGRVPDGSDPDRYDTRHAHCEVLVIGAGQAGVDAALRAQAAGQRVMLVDQSAGVTAAAGAARDQPGIEMLMHTTAVAHYDHDLVAMVESVTSGRPRERLWLVRASRVVLATGAIEQPMIFANNDRPGVMLAGAALTYVQRHSVAPGREVVVATNNDSAYSTVRALREAGVRVSTLIDSRESPPAERLAEMNACGVPVRTGSMPVDTRGFGALSCVAVGKLGGPRGVSATENLACDALLLSGGWSPLLHLFAQAGGKLQFQEESSAFEATASLPSIEVTGAAAGRGQASLGPRISPVGDRSRQWVDLRHDVTVADIELSVRENFTAVEHVKRYTTLGMSADQGKVGQAPATEIIARARHVSPGQLGHTTFRPPFVPVTLGTLVGRNAGKFLAPGRESPLHGVQTSAGALFDDFGEWRRAAVFPRAGESRAAGVDREVQLVRNGVGIFDASPLGKIELAGPDALDFADRFYINNLAALTPNRARYGIMLRETGTIFDDGTVVVLDEDRVLLTTTSGGAGRVAAWLEEWRQCEWPDLRVVVSPVTDQWTTVALTGQFARTVLSRLKPECGVTNESLPHLGVRVTRLFGDVARIYRVSYSGELTFEINVPAHRGPRLWSALMDEGRDFGLAPFGVDALLHLRMEKGFIHVGSDTDGTTVPDDIGFGKAAAGKQRHYVGKRSLSLPEHIRPDRLQLVGLAGEGGGPLPVGSHLLLPDSADPTDGWITSAGALSTSGRPIALALLRAGRRQLNKTVSVHVLGRRTATARVVSPVFYDPPGARMNG